VSIPRGGALRPANRISGACLTVLRGSSVATDWRCCSSPRSRRLRCGWSDSRLRGLAPRRASGHTSLPPTAR